MSIAAVEHGASFDRVLRALEDHGKQVRRRGWQANAQCPAHEDREPSLSVTWREGRTLLHCFGGCTGEGKDSDPSPVLDALGLAMPDLSDAPPTSHERRHSAPRRPRGASPAAGSQGPAAATPRKQDTLGRPTGRWKVTAEYVYADESGSPVGKVVREQQQHEHGYAKRFWQWHWIGQCPAQPCESRSRGRVIPHTEGWGKGAPAHRVLYRLPEVMAAVAAGHEVWLPEGEKDADALAEHFITHGIPAAATTNAGGAGSWADSYAEALRGAHVVLVEDNDPDGVNPATGEPREGAGRRRSRRLLAELAGTTASVRVVRAKTGKDSFAHLAAGHTLAQFVPVPAPAGPAGPEEQAGPAAETPPPGRRGLRVLPGGSGGLGGGGGDSGGGQAGEDTPNRRTHYQIRHGEIVKCVTDRYGETHYDVVLGCVATWIRIDQKVITDDDPPATTGYLVRAEHPDRPGEVCEFQVTRKAWDSADWLYDLPWAGVTYDSSRSGLARIRDAVRMISTDAATAKVHGAPGWVRDDDGSWIYVHAGGALGADGPVAAETALPSKLARFALPEPPANPAALRAAAAHSAGLVTTLPPRIGAVLAGLAYRAAVSRMPPSVTLIGPPGSYKTSMGKVALHHFAPDLPWDESVLSLSERGATGNAAAKLMNLTRDVLLLADDAAPDRSLKAAAERVASIIRLQYNGETRDRLDREAELQRPTPPRGSLLISAEVGPSAASASQRTLIVPLHNGEISRDTRIAVWEPVSRHARAATLASFITWQAGRRDQVLEQLDALAAGYADTWHDAGHDERTAEALAHLAAGWRLMLNHLTDQGAYTQAEAEQLWQQAWAGLDEAGRLQNDPDEPADPPARILARLRTGLLGRFGYLSDTDGMPPPAAQAPRYGWVAEPPPVRSGSAGLDVTPVPVVRAGGGDPIGCYADADGQRRLWLIPELTLMMLRKVCDRLGEPFEETTSSVGEWLRKADIGLATTTEKSTGRVRRSRQQTMPGGTRPWIWDIPESALYDDPGTGEDDGQPRPRPPAPPGPGAPGNVADARQDDGQQQYRAPADSHHPRVHGEDLVISETAQAPAPRWPGLFAYPQLLDMAAQDSVLDKDPAQLRRRYCTITLVRADDAQPCAGCGATCTVLVGEVPLHLACPDPPASWQAPPAAPVPAQPAPASRPSGPAAAQSPGHQGRPRAAAHAEPRWRAAAAVLTDSGIYLPGGEVEPLPVGLAHAGNLGDLPRHLNLGWSGGKLPPFAGQLWLTASFLTRAGLPVPPPGQTEEDRDLMLADAAARPFITAALADGWQISDASRTRLGHRMRIWRESNRAGAHLVYIPYIVGEVHLLDGDPDPAALASRLDLYARHVGVPFGRSAAYSGHDLLLRVDGRRKIVLDGPADPPPVHASGTGLVTFQRVPSGDEAGRRFVHSYDATAAWLAAAQGTELGVGEPVHQDQPVFDPRLPGLWLVTRPRWDTWAIPDPFTTRRRRDNGPAWYYTPLLALAADLLGAEIRPAEAWVWPKNTRYLDLWAGELNTARLALSGPPPGYRAGDPDTAAVLATLKDTYSGAVTLFGSSQIDADTSTGRARHKLFRPDWAHTVIATATARLYRKVLQAEQAMPGRWPLAIDRDNLLYASDEPDPVAACPPPMKTGNQLGQVKNKGSARMEDAAGPLAAGRFAFDTLVPPGRWDAVRGGPADGSG